MTHQPKSLQFFAFAAIPTPAKEDVPDAPLRLNRFRRYMYEEGDHYMTVPQVNKMKSKHPFFARIISDIWIRKDTEMKLDWYYHMLRNRDIYAELL